MSIDVFLQVLTYINVSATFVGIDNNFAPYLVSISNAGSAFGRVIAGLLADRLGVWRSACDCRNAHVSLQDH